MTDLSNRERSPSFPSLFHSPYDDISASTYSQTTSMVQDESENNLQYPTNDYEVFEACKWCGGYDRSCGCQNSNDCFGDGAAVGDSWDRDIQDQDSMEWGAAPVYQGLWGGTDRVMAGTGEQQEMNGVAEGPHDQRFKRPPQTSPFGMDTYSSTVFTTYGIHYSPTQSSQSGVNDQPWSPVSQSDAKHDKQSRWNEADLEANFRASQCLLDGCRKGYIFKTLQSYRSHLKNVHGKGISCRVLGCRHTKPFASKNDEDRHYRAKHDTNAKKTFKCERSGCAARVRSWKRKDKLLEHDRKYHMEIVCHICSHYFDNEEELFEHTNLDHAWIG
ncbi:hypothetical protein BDZ45DRAFT_137464 [Acephala macrosclerotiorum]|nr:hypothetical protein BDZ45DRAFT_137464 [Acephala macrosclerotiorum]